MTGRPSWLAVGMSNLISEFKLSVESPSTPTETRGYIGTEDAAVGYARNRWPLEDGAEGFIKVTDTATGESFLITAGGDRFTCGDRFPYDD